MQAFHLTGRLFASRRRVAVFLAFAALLLLGVSARVGESKTPPPPPSGGSVTSAAFGAAQAPTTLFPVFNPPVNTIAQTYLTLQQSWRPLIFLGPDLKVDWPRSIAKSVTHNAENTVFDIQMKSTFTWTDGQVVTASDQLYQWNLIKADCPNLKVCSWFYATSVFPATVNSLEVTGKFSFRISLSKPMSPESMILSNLTHLTPLPAHVWSTDPSTHAKICADVYCADPAEALADFTLLKNLGTDPTSPVWQVVDGPFRPGPWIRNQSYTLLRNAKYTGGHKSYLDKIVFLYYTSDSAEFQALQAGNLDIGYVPVDAVDSRKIKGYKFWNVPFWGYNPILLNQGNLNNPNAARYCRRDICKILNMLPVRIALQSAIDQPNMVKRLFKDFAQLTYSSTPASPATYLTPLAKKGPYPYSLDRSRQELAKAGFRLEDGVMTYRGPAGGNLPAAGAKLRFELLYTPVAPYVTREALIWQAELSKLGIDVNLQGLTPDAIFGKIFPSGNDNWDAVTFVGGGSSRPYPTAEANFQCVGSPFNVEGFCDPALDALISDTLVKGGPASYAKFENFVATNLPHIWLPTPSLLLAETKTRVGGYESQLSPVGYAPLEELYVQK
jgi:peptide/nickel transport system substrate-binding protein